MKNKQIISIAFVGIFVLMLILPLININKRNGVRSKVENRILASFPDIYDENGGLNKGLKTDFEAWINDNIGFRDYFVSTYSKIKLNILKASPTDKVEIGKEGWYFYTPNNNIELATGEYPLDETLLERIAENQLRIQEYYKSKGIEYVLVLAPSKVSVYPEYLREGQYDIRETVCDIVERYLNENTDINVINVKDEVIKGKSQGMMYHKTDTHWTQMGASIAYSSVIEKLRNMGIVNTTVADMSFYDAEYEGEFSGLMGCRGLLGKEIVPFAEILESKAVEVNEGRYYEEVQKIVKENGVPDNRPGIVFKNASVPEKKVLIYGDSMFNWWNVPNMFAENFSELTFTRMTSINEELDDLANPDVVIFEATERLITSVLVNDPKISIQEIPDVKEISAVGRGYKGMWIDSCNGAKVEEQGTIVIDESDDKIKFTGWAVDFNQDMPVSQIYLEIEDKIIKCDYESAKPSVAKVFQNNNLLNTGFSVSFPREYLKGNTVKQIRFILVGNDGSYKYEPIVYNIIYR